MAEIGAATVVVKVDIAQAAQQFRDIATAIEAMADGAATVSASSLAALKQMLEWHDSGQAGDWEVMNAAQILVDSTESINRKANE